MFKIFNHIVFFVLSKSAVVLAPLIAAGILNSNDYGLFEFAISTSMIIATSVSLASGNTIAFEKIRDNNSPLIKVGKNYSLLMFIIFSMITFLSILFIQSNVLSMISAICSILIIKEPLGAFMKASGLGAKATIIDSVLYIIFLLLLLIMFINGKSSLSYFFALPFFGIIIALYLNNTIKSSTRDLNKNNFLRFYNRGLPIMISGIASIIFFSSPRLFLANFGMIEVSTFSLYLRWASIALIGYQFIYVLLFKNIYTKNYNEFENFTIKILVAVFFIGISLIPIINLLSNNNDLFFRLPAANIPLQLLMAIIIIVWVCSGLLEGILFKEKKSLFNLYSNSLGLSVFSITYFIMNPKFENLIEFITMSWGFSFFFNRLFSNSFY